MAAAYRYRLMDQDEIEKVDGDPYNPGAKRRGRGRYLCVRVLLVALGLTVIALLSLFLARCYYAHSQVCLTADCVEISAYIQGRMNQSVDPCEDFYRYACGGWESRSQIPGDHAKFDGFTEVASTNSENLKQLLEEKGNELNGRNSSSVEKAKRFYQNCLDTKRIEKIGTQRILKVIQDFGSWSIAPGSGSSVESWDLMSSLIHFQSAGSFPLFELSLSVDSKNNSRHLPYFSQSGLSLSAKDEYNETRFIVALRHFAVAVASLLGGDNSTHSKIEAILDFEKSLAKIFVDKEKMVDPNKMYNLMSVSQFQQLIGPQIEVKRLMSSVMNASVSDSDTVVVLTPDYFRKLDTLLASTNHTVLRDYMMWHLVQRLPGYLPQAFLDAVMKLNQEELGITTLSPRWKRCLHKVDSAFGFATAALYVHRHFPPHSKLKALAIMRSVQASFQDNLQSMQWMDAGTRERARKKSAMMDMAVGYPDWILNLTRLDSYYEKAEVKEGEFLENFLNLARYERVRLWNKRGTKPSKDEWIMLPQSVNAFFSPTNNQMVVLAGLLQRPFFDPHYPLSFAYGAMGSIAGHELTHGFDNAGRSFDESGNLNNWWSDTSTQAFQEKAQCMRDQYSRYTMYGHHLNGAFTLTENIADNGGLKIGYIAYEKEAARQPPQPTLPGLALTPQQLFFVGYTQIWCALYTRQYALKQIASDEHVVSRLRVLGALSNSHQFSESFNCPKNSVYNPPHKCHVW